MSKYTGKYPCNHAYIDAANLDKGTERQGWRVDYGRFRTWLKEKHRVKRAYIFIGYMSKYDKLYSKMRNAGFLVRFREVTDDGNGQVKGNCDSDMVLRSVRDVFESIFDDSFVISSDGDFGGLVEFLMEKGKSPHIISPNQKCSILLRNKNIPVTYLNDIKKNLALS